MFGPLEIPQESLLLQRFAGNEPILEAKKTDASINLKLPKRRSNGGAVYALTKRNIDQVEPGFVNYMFSLKQHVALFLNKFLMAEKSGPQSV